MSDSVTFLGTSDGLASTDRNHTSLLLRLAGQIVLVDCGQPCSQTLKKMRVEYETINAIVVTHSHSDHIGGLPMLMQSIWLEKRTRPLPIHLPSGIIQPLQAWLRACYLFEENFSFQPQWAGLSAAAPFHIGPVAVRTFRTSHLDKTRSQFGATYPDVAFDAFSLLFEANGKRFGFSGDLGDPQDLAELCAQPLDLLAVELAHFHPSKLIEFLKDKPIAHVAITHMNRQVREKLPEIRELFTKELPAQRLSFVKDGDVIPF